MGGGHRAVSRVLLLSSAIGPHIMYKMRFHVPLLPSTPNAHTHTHNRVRRGQKRGIDVWRSQQHIKCEFMLYTGKHIIASHMIHTAQTHTHTHTIRNDDVLMLTRKCLVASPSPHFGFAMHFGTDDMSAGSLTR